MASEVRVNQIQNRSGLGTITVADSGVVISGITTISDLRTSGTTVVAAGTTSAPSISPSGDSNTGIFFPSADTVAIAEGGTEVLRVDSNGRLGIGSATPGFQLTVDQGTTDGNLFDLKNEEVRLLTGVWGTGATYPREITLNATRFDSGTVPALRLAGQGGIKFAVDLNTVRMEIDSSGRVLKPYTPHIFGSIGNNSTQNNSFASYMNVFTSTELTFSNSRITVPVTGVYMITFTTISDNVTARKDANIFINGTSRLAMLTDDSSTGYKYRSGSMSVRLSANDYIQFYNATWYDYTNTGYIDWRTASVTLLG